MNTLTAALVTDPEGVPQRAARTLAIVAASASKDASTSRIDWTCVAERPDAGTAGVTGVAGVAGTAGVSDVAGVAGVAGVAELPLLLVVVLLLVLPPVLPPPEEQRVVAGVIVTVTVAVGSNFTSD